MKISLSVCTFMLFSLEQFVLSFILGGRVEEISENSFLNFTGTTVGSFAGRTPLESRSARRTFLHGDRFLIEL